MNVKTTPCAYWDVINTFSIHRYLTHAITLSVVQMAHAHQRIKMRMVLSVNVIQDSKEIAAV